MSSISINLLPIEILVKRKQGSKASSVNTASIIVLVIFIIITALVFAFSLYQSSQLANVKEELTAAEERVKSLNKTEGQVFLIKQRLTLLQTLSNTDNKKKALFNIITDMVPADTKVLDATIDKKGMLAFSLRSPSLASIETLINSLNDNSKTQDLISRVDLESLSFSKSGVYSADFRVTSKK
jgi:hypothetical protein